MNRTLRVLPDAEAELLSAAMWYEDKRPGLGVELVAAVDRTFESILENPEACPSWRGKPQYRTWPLKRFPYLLVFRVDSAMVQVVAVAHAKRQPGYWRDRRR